VIQNQNPINIPEKNTTEVQIQEQDHSNISEIIPEGNQMQAEKETQPQRAEQNRDGNQHTLRTMFHSTLNVNITLN
jgi:hypothetical protein